MIAKRVRQLSFMCGMTSCPKHRDEFNSFKFKNANPPIRDNFRKKGCHQFATTVWSLSQEALSDDEVAALPLIAVVMPNPDPTGAQGVGGGLGVSKDIIFEQLFRANGYKSIAVAIIYLVRGFQFNKTLRSELVAAALPKPAINFCFPYLERDIATLKPQKILLCGQDVLSMFYPGETELAVFRRQYGNTINIQGVTYPVQGTFSPYLASIAPVYIKTIFEDCKKLFNDAPVSAPTSYRLLTDFEEALDYIEFLQDFDGYISFDVETQSLHRKATNRLATLQFATNFNKGVVLPYQHWQTPFAPNEIALIQKRLRQLFSKPINSKGWIAHNAKFENMILDMHFGVMLDSAPIYDTQAMAFLQDETRSERKADKPRDGGIYTLKQLAWDYLNFTGYDKGILKIRGDGALFDLPLEELAAYGAMDSVVTFRLFHKIIELAKEDDAYDEKLLKFARLFYGPLTKLIAHIERTGFKTDLRSLRQLSGKRGPFETRLTEITEKLKRYEAFHEANKLLVQDRSAGISTGVLDEVPWVLDFNKPDHQALVFFKVMDLEPVSFSDKTNRPAIDDEFFDAYKEEHREVELFSQLQETKKMQTTFINKIMERVDPATGDADCRIDQRIRPDIHYARLVTGRLAMVNPNMGQIPKAEEGLEPAEFGVRKSVKDIFTVDRGGALIQIDYKVNEVRWAAILAQDEELARIFNDAAKRVVEACESGDPDLIKKAEFMEDIHRNTASAAFGVTIEEVTKKQRQASKAITFGILFQQSDKALAENIGVSEEEAAEFKRKFFAKMQGVEHLIFDLKHSAKTRGYVEAPHGRRRRFWSFYLPDSYPYKQNHEARNLRQAVNSPIQGIASDAAMYGGAYSLLEYIRREKRNWLIQNVVHDSCLLQVTDASETAEAMLLAKNFFVDEAMKRMEEMGVKFNLPLGIDLDAGRRWGSLEKWNGTKDHAHLLQQKIIDEWACE